jgi:hypothetical protein
VTLPGGGNHNASRLPFDLLPVYSMSLIENGDQFEVSSIGVGGRNQATAAPARPPVLARPAVNSAALAPRIRRAFPKGSPEIQLPGDVREE